MSTYNKDKQQLVTVNNGAATPAQQQKTTAAAPAKTTAAKAAQPVKYQADPVDRTQYQYDASSNAAYQQALNALLAAQKEKPTYAGTYDGQLDQIYNQIVNRKPFTYDVNEDMLYQQYADQYQTKGNLAMRDTMGQAAALTGGYANTFAQIAGQQQYDAYLQQLNEVVPQLYGMAQDQYNREGDALQQQFAMTGDLSDREYGRYQDALNNYWQNVSYLQGQADNEYNRGYENWYNAEQMGMQQDQFNYQQYLDEYDRNFQQEQWQYQQEQDAYERQYQELLDNWNKSFQESQFAYQKEQDSLESQWRDKQYQQEQAQIAYEKQLQAYSTLSELITATGYVPSAAELQAAGMSEAQAQAYRNYYAQQTTQAAASRSSGGGSGSGSGGSGGSGKGSGSGGSGSGSGGSGDTGNSGTGGLAKGAAANLSGREVRAKNFKGSTYNEAVSYMKSNGVSNGNAAGIMTQSEWSSRKAAYQHSGQGGTEVTDYDSYKEYLKAIVEYKILTSGMEE